MMQFLREEFKSWLASKDSKSYPCQTRLPGRNYGNACPLEVYAFDHLGEVEVCITVGGDYYIDIHDKQSLPEWARRFVMAVDGAANSARGPRLWDSLTAEQLLAILEEVK